MAIIIQQDATVYSLFKSVNCSTYFGWYFTHYQELITLYLQYLALMRPLLLPVMSAAGWELQFSGLINARYCRYSDMSSWWRMKYHHKHAEQLTDLNKVYSVASCWIIIAIYYTMHSLLNVKKKIHSLVMISKDNPSFHLFLCITDLEWYQETIISLNIYAMNFRSSQLGRCYSTRPQSWLLPAP